MEHSQTVAADRDRIRSFSDAPVLDDVEVEDRGMVELIGLVFLDSQRPRAICTQWVVDTYTHHYNIVFDLLQGTEITDMHLQTLRDVNVVRVQRVLVGSVDGCLRVTVQLAKATHNQLITEEHLLRIVRVTRRPESPPSAKRRRSNSDNNT